MDEDNTVEETPQGSLRDQLGKLVLATAVSFIAGKLAETAYDAAVTKIREVRSTKED